MNRIFESLKHYAINSYLLIAIRYTVITLRYLSAAIIALSLLIHGCTESDKPYTPVKTDITESIYASGLVKSKNQYEVYATVSGIVDSLFLTEGDTIRSGDVVLTISNRAQVLNRDNARLTLDYDDINANQGKLAEAKQAIGVARSKMINDSLLFERQQNLYLKSVGSKVDAEQREVAYENSRLNYISAIERYDNLKRQIALSASRSKNNLRIADQVKDDYSVRSIMNGTVYSLTVAMGELVTPQKSLAIIGDSRVFNLEMQVDERDIARISKGMRVVVTLNSQKNEVYEALVSKISPLMSQQSKSFMVEAEFVQQPDVIYPNVTFEANIVVQTKKDVLIVPREYLIDGAFVQLVNGNKVRVQTGLSDYNHVEIISGITNTDQLTLPAK